MKNTQTNVGSFATAKLQAKRHSLLAIIALAAVMAVVSSCAILSTTGGTGDVHGIFTFSETASKDATEIASYTVVLGLFDIGYAGYDTKVKEAEARGRKVTSVTKFYFFFTTTTSYAR